jgi:hypothetical protein
MNAGASNTLVTGTNVSISMWFKSTTTNGDYMLQNCKDVGSTNISIIINNSSEGNITLLHYDTSGFKYLHYAGSANDGNWHHVVVALTATTQALYFDGVLRATATEDFPNSASSDQTTIAGFEGDYAGSIDEVAIWNSVLTPSQVLQIYNGGSPADLKEFSPDSWYRMGDDDDAGGTTIRDLGVVSTTELVENGEFGANTTGWAAANSATITSEGGRLKVANAGGVNHGYANQEVTVVVGARYKVTADLVFSAGTAVDMKFKLGTTVGEGEYYDSGDITADTTITQYITATTTSLFIKCQNSGNGGTLAYFDNISVKQDDLVLNGGFTDASVPDTWNGAAAVNLAGWTNAGAPHTAAAHFTITGGKCRVQSDGTNVQIIQNILTEGLTYEYSLEVTDVTAGGLTVYGGTVLLENNVTATGLLSGTFIAPASTNFIIKRYTGTTDVTFDNVSVKQINGNPGTLVNTPTFSTDIP